jgi:hypothetical protein
MLPEPVARRDERESRAVSLERRYLDNILESEDEPPGITNKRLLTRAFFHHMTK